MKVIFSLITLLLCQTRAKVGYYRTIDEKDKTRGIVELDSQKSPLELFG